MVNPAMLLKIKKAKDKFVSNHPKFPLFLNAVYRDSLIEDSIIEISVTRPDGEKISSNLKLKQSDIEMLRDFQELMKNSK